jgi:hypothetical protein
MDYSRQQIVALQVGEAKIQSATFKLVHIEDMEIHRKVVGDIDEVFKQSNKIKPVHNGYIKYELEQVKEFLDDLSPTKKPKDR